jgi:hypothetical protein
MTDTKTLNRETPAEKPSDKPTEPKPRLVEMSASQLAGGALAAMTAAVIGAQLGVAGTVLGAAIGSIVAGVAGSLYTASLKTTKDKIASAFVGRVGDTPVEVATVSDDTAEIDGWDSDTAAKPAAAMAPPSADPVATSAEVDQAGKPTARLPWKPILVSAAAVFLLAIAGITGFELISGQSVSGGEGTTITQVSEGRSGSSDTPSETPSSDTSTEPSAEASTQPSTEPSVAPSTSTETSEPTTESTSEPTTTAEPSSSSEPSSTETPTPAAGDEGVEGSDTGDGTVVGR